MEPRGRNVRFDQANNLLLTTEPTWKECKIRPWRRLLAAKVMVIAGRLEAQDRCMRAKLARRAMMMVALTKAVAELQLPSLNCDG
jgi:hypothetical protein